MEISVPLLTGEVNMSLASSFSPSQLHANEGFRTLKELYQRFYAEDSCRWSVLWGNDWGIDCLKKRNEKIASDPSIFSRLSIEIPPLEMRAIYEKYGVIALRKLRHPNLLLYCGNSPLYCTATEKEYTSENHQHSECDTVDVDLLMNPSIVMKWPNVKAMEYFSPRKYKIIRGEGMSCFKRNNVIDALTCLGQILDKGGKCLNNRYTYSPAVRFFNKIQIRWFFRELTQHFPQKVCSWSLWKKIFSCEWYQKWYSCWKNLGNMQSEIATIQEIGRSHQLKVTVTPDQGYRNTFLFEFQVAQ